MSGLTSRQNEILRMIVDFIGENGYPPTRTEIGDHFGFSSPTGVQDHLYALQKKGFIEIVPRLSRGIRIIYECE